MMIDSLYRTIFIFAIISAFGLNLFHNIGHWEILKVCFMYLIPAFAPFWIWFFNSFYEKHGYSLWTSKKLKPGESNPEGIKRFIIIFLEVILFAGAQAMIFATPAAIVNQSKTRTKDPVTWTLVKKSSYSGSNGASWRFWLKDDHGIEHEINVGRTIYDSATEGNQINAIRVVGYLGIEYFESVHVELAKN